ncbi:MAG: hypothetical protein ACOC2Y_02585 [Spirochaetota bacterium]
MRGLFATTILLSLASLLPAQTLRGPTGPTLVVTPTGPAEGSGIGLETIAFVEIEGDARFLEAIDIELTAPSAVAEQAGALSLYVMGPVDVRERGGVADVVGEELLRRPLVRGGKSFYQIVLQSDARPDASPAVTRVGTIVPPTSFPLAISVVPRMKGLSESIQESEFSLAARPVTRNVGAIEVRYEYEDGTVYDPTGARAPEFELYIDDELVTIATEYLLPPGLHRLHLRSDRFQDQEVTVGVDRGRAVPIRLPLDLALATVSYSAPRGSSVYVNGRALDGHSGDFTVPPGEHTIVVVLGDYSVTRRFSAEEQQTYTISVTMDILVEEIK